MRAIILLISSLYGHFIKGATKFKTMFCVRHKNKRKHNQHFKLLFFKVNLRFITSNQILTYRKLNLFIRSSIYLVVLPTEMQRRLKQPKYTTRFFTSSEKKWSTNFKSSSFKKPFLQCICYLLVRLAFMNAFHFM